MKSHATHRFKVLRTWLCLSLLLLPFSLAHGVKRPLSPTTKPRGTGQPIVPAPAACASDLGEAVAPAKDSSIPAGIISHGEHWVDLILSQAGTSEARHLDAFSKIARQLLEQINNGLFPIINEKIDGSPSVVLGFNTEKNPFIAYKGTFASSRKTNQNSAALMTSLAGARNNFADKPELADLYGHAIELFGDSLRARCPSTLHDYVFQGDLLFSPQNDRIERSETTVRIRANSLVYTIEKSSELWPKLERAKIGIVIHTVGRRVVSADGTLSVEPLSDGRAVIEGFVDALKSENILALTPWHYNVALHPKGNLPTDFQARAQRLLTEIATNLNALGPEFKLQWAKSHQKRFRTYFNSMLHPPHDGGIYRVAAGEEPLNFAAILEDYNRWLTARLQPRAGATSLETASYAKLYSSFLSQHHDELERLLGAYYAAIRLQYLLMPQMQEVLKSKLGGSDVEGIMLSTDNTIVKFVDRLGFTLHNNAVWGRGAAANNPAKPVISQAATSSTSGELFQDLPIPFQIWQPGALMVLLKGQPIHSGHIKLIREAMARSQGAPVYVIASNKGPNLTANSWKALNVSTTKQALKERNYTYILDNALRKEILDGAIGDSTPIFFLSPTDFWRYIQRAHDLQLSGKVKLVLGEKEIEEGRYDAQLSTFSEQIETLSIPPFNDGISGTQVRAALRDANLGTESKKRKANTILNQAFAELPEDLRAAIKLKAINAWRQVDTRAQEVLRASNGR